MAASLVYNNYTKEKLINRCYEIRTDKDILAYDRMTLIFGGIGWYWKRFQGAVDGINFALLYIIFHLKISKKYLNPISPDIHELIGNEKYKNVEDAEFNRQKLFQFIKKKLESLFSGTKIIKEEFESNSQFVDSSIIIRKGRKKSATVLDESSKTTTLTEFNGLLQIIPLLSSTFSNSPTDKGILKEFLSVSIILAINSSSFHNSFGGNGIQIQCIKCLMNGPPNKLTI
ncbi:hypothetical protein Mgra_00003411 [Meloidogyne graminicola]|uniref:Uncharacterized protein n=1 Tax=Meloidogyne graminicola TaxID=189291 RepID=A0A8S9ZUM7_9BILA|nr:hypothetical protein Mgra_00003411 [Meloidogyne graminicola]